MMDDELWSEWVEHDGRGCPVPYGTIILAVFKYTGECVAPAGSRGGRSWDWSAETEGWDPILRYRTRIYRAGIDLIANSTELVPALCAESL